jgi:hypothetical protein
MPPAIEQSEQKRKKLSFLAKASHCNISKAEIEPVYLKIKVTNSQTAQPKPLDPMAVKSTIHEAMKETFGMINGSLPVDLIALEKDEFIVRMQVRQHERLLLASLFFRTSMMGMKCKFELVSRSHILAFLQ